MHGSHGKAFMSLKAMAKFCFSQINFESLEITDKTEEIDGEKVYILEKHMKTGVERLKELARMNKDDDVLAMLNRDSKFICEKQNFAIAFRDISPFLL